MFFGHFRRNNGGDLAVDHHIFKTDVRDIELLSRDLYKFFLGNHSQGNKYLSDSLARGLLFIQSNLKLLGRYYPAFDQKLANPFFKYFRRHISVSYYRQGGFDVYQLKIDKPHNIFIG